MQFEAEPIKSTADYREDTLRILFALEAEHGIVGEADEKRSSTQSRLDLLFEPFVEYCVQQNVTEKGEITPPWGVPRSGYTTMPSLKTPARSHLPMSAEADEPENNSITYPLVQDVLHHSSINGMEGRDEHSLR